jgi:hypothetical protein
MKRNLWLILMFVLFVSACSKSDNDSSGDNNSGEVFTKTCNRLVDAGLVINVDGDISSLMDISNMQSFQAYSTCIQACDQEDLNCMMDCMALLGIVPPGAPFSVVCYIENITTSTITFTIEAGDWFLPSSDDFQPMLCPIDIIITIEAGETVTEVIPVYCLDSGLSAPDDDSEYTICDMISSSGCLTDIVAILQTKDMSNISYEKAQEVQMQIWNCTSGQTVDFDVLNDLPNL